MAARKNETVEKTTENAEQKVQETQKKTEQVAAAKKYVVKVDSNPNYCGIGAGGVQFANGQAVIESERMAAWFREHNGYTVTDQ